VNDTLRRALFEAQLSATDLAARFGVDPKTARRWLDGRLPYGRHREQIARLLGLDEGAIWPEVRPARPAGAVPAELAAAYPRRNLIPQEAWLSTFTTARTEIDVLAYSAGFLIEDSRFLQILADKADRGVKVAVALADPRRLDLARAGAEEEDTEDALSVSVGAAIDRILPLEAAGQVELRLHDVLLYNSIYRVDNQLLVNQHLYGIATSRTPVYHLHKADKGEMFDFYLTSFDRVWENASPASS
jgi:hypothetical protein